MDPRLDASARPHGVQWWRLVGMYGLLLAVASSCTLSMPAILSADSGAPAQLGEIDGACWDASSLAVIEARKLHLPNSVGAFWDFMAYLHTSPQPGHHSAFMKLAQLFWGRYVDCVLSRAHGLGRRESRRESIIISRD